ncbi:MAG TPA: hypothetical protein VFZ34_12440 [Blastocatellia bacterium]|nr:hypothetical protein [Blastocatellia bacterium]
MKKLEDAQQIAAQEVERRRQTSEFWQQVEDLSEARLANETADFWVFFARSQNLIDASHAPGGMFVAVDKQTGRIWSREEIGDYYAQRASSESQKIAA